MSHSVQPEPLSRSMMTIDEVAEVLSVSPSTLYREHKAHGDIFGLPVVQYGRLVRIPRHAVEEHIRQANGAAQ